VASRRDATRDAVRFRVLSLLQENPELSVREIAERVGVSSGSAYYLLKALIDKGMIKLGNFAASKHKHRYAYVLTPQGMKHKAGLTARFLKMRLEEYEALRQEIEQLQRELDDERSRSEANDGVS
jgi:EPS-associated MarR family transcriptional regulator